MKIGPKYKICRRLGERVFSKCQTTKFIISSSDNRRGRGKRRKQLSEYGRQLLEKQKARYTYAVSEKQFSNYVKKAVQNKKSNPQENLYKLLESRLDNIVFRLGLTNSRLAARQMVSHGHILVNDKRTTIPSQMVKIGDKISVRPQSSSKGFFNDFEERTKNVSIPDWLHFDSQKKVGEIKSEPIIKTDELVLNFPSIIEFYSRV